MKIITENYQKILVAIFVFLTYGLILNFLFFVGFSLRCVTFLVDVFNKTALGIGAILAGIGGLTYLKKWFDEDILNKKIQLFQNQYSPEKYSKKMFEIVQNEDKKGKLYIFDTKRNTIHHIANYLTYLDIGLNIYEINTIPSKEFAKLSEGEIIQTRIQN